MSECSGEILLGNKEKKKRKGKKKGLAMRDWRFDIYLLRIAALDLARRCRVGGC